MKILCVYISDYRDREDYFLSLMPYGITSIAACLEQSGHEVVLANLSEFGYTKGVEITLKENPDAVAVSIFSFNRTESLKYIRELKKRNRNTLIIAGGQHPTFLAEEILSNYPEIDHIIRGEGEIALDKLLKRIPGSTEKIIDAERIPDISVIPYSARFSGKTIGVNPNEQFKYIITSRGCPSGCTYCSSPYFWKNKVTYRSTEDIISELEHIQKKYGIITFSIRDDNFTLNKRRVIRFCKDLQNSGLYMIWNCQARVDTIDEEMLVEMKKSGLEHIQFGVESGSEKILKVYNKKITIPQIKLAAELTKKTGIYLSFYLMSGMEGETDDDIKKTMKLISETGPDDVIVSPVAYYPGTKIYSDSVKSGKIQNSIWFETDDNGLYLDNSVNADKNIQRILEHSATISASSSFKSSDFALHRKTTGECWMNHITEGDYHLSHENIDAALKCYDRIIDRYPLNIWGYLRRGEIIADYSPDEAIAIFKIAIEIVPNYYGTWFRLAQLQSETGLFSDAKKSASTALRLNPHITEIKRFARSLNKFK